MKVCLEEKIAIPGFYPCLSIPLSWRKSVQTLEQYRELGNTNGTTFIQELLAEKIELGGENSFVLDSNICIKSPNGQNLKYLTTEVTKFKSEFLLVEDLDDETFRVSLAKPPPKDPPCIKDQPLDRSDLIYYKQFTKEFGYSYSPHRYPKLLTRGLNLYLRPHMMDERRLERYVGMSTEKYWRLVDKLNQTALPGKTKLKMEQLTLMYWYVNLKILSAF